MGLLTDILKEIPTSGVLKERVALAEQKYELLERENEGLKQENTRLKAENSALKKSIPGTDFVEARGALFKRKADGAFEPDAYCPTCNSALFSLHATMPLSCSKCNYVAPIRKTQIGGIISELAQ